MKLTFSCLDHAVVSSTTMASLRNLKSIDLKMMGILQSISVSDLVCSHKSSDYNHESMINMTNPGF